MRRWLGVLFVLMCCGWVAGCGDDDDDAADGDADADADTDADADVDADADGDGDGDADADGTCEAPIVLAFDVGTDGNNTGADTLADPSCGGSVDQPSQVYQLDLPNPGVLTVNVDSAGWEPVVSARTDCGDAGSETLCAAGGPLVWCADQEGPVAIVVDGAGAAADGLQDGPFTITASLAPPCGEGQTCVPGVGCGVAGDTCDLPVELDAGDSFTGTTIGATDDVQANCTFGDDGGDASFLITTPQAGVLGLTVTPVGNYNPILLTGGDCGQGNENFCGETRAISVCADGVLSVTLDGSAGFAGGDTEGDYTLDTTFVACAEGEVCRGGPGAAHCVPVLQGGETCDSAVALTLGSEVGGTLDGAADDVALDCFEQGNDVVYSLDIPNVGFLDSFVAGVSVNGVLRSACDVAGVDECNGGFVSSCVSAGQYSLVVDGTSPDYSVSTTFESCDPGEVCRPFSFPSHCVTPLDGGDLCANAPALPLNTTVAGTTVGAADDYEASCVGTTGADVTYSIELPSQGLLRLETQAAGSISASIRTTCDDNGTEVACSQGFNDVCVPAGLYGLVIDGDSQFGGDEFEYSLAANFTACEGTEVCRSFSFPDPCVEPLQGGDTCGDAVVLPFDTTVAGSTVGTVNDLELGCLQGSVGGDVVYRVTAPVAGALSTTLSSLEGMSLGIRTDCADVATEVSCTNSFGAGQAARTCVEAGELELVVDADSNFGGGDSEFTLSASFIPCEAGEVCEGGRCVPPLTPEVEPNDDGDTAQSLTDVGGVDASLADNDDVDYFTIDLLADQTLTLDLGICTLDTVVFVYDSPLSDPLPDETRCNRDAPAPALACNDDAETLCSFLQFVAPADGTYYVRVVSYSGSSNGDYSMIVDVE